MKKVILFFMILFGLSFANDLDWADSFTAAKQQAAKEDKLIMVMVSQVDCRSCEYMKEVAFDDETLADYMETNFVMLELDMNARTELKELKVFGTPTTYIFKSNGDKIGRQIIGRAAAPAFLKKLQEYKAKASN
jgi:thioredoxin-related protein